MYSDMLNVFPQRPYYCTPYKIFLALLHSLTHLSVIVEVEGQLSIGLDEVDLGQQVDVRQAQAEHHIQREKQCADVFGSIAAQVSIYQMHCRQPANAMS